MNNNKLPTLIVSLGIILLLSLGESLDAKEYTVPTLKADIAIDGDLSEDTWRSAEKVLLNYQTSPSENTKAQFKTEALLFKDDKYLYIGFNASDPKPDNIQAYYHDRDRLTDDDRVGIRLDTFSDNRRSYNFFVSPLGIQEDSIEDDVLDREDFSWDAIWFSAAKITKQGYSVEIKIPFSILRFPDSSNNTDNAIKDIAKWSMDFVRYVPRDYNYRLASAKVDRNINCTICQFDKVSGFSDIKAGNNLEWVPYFFLQKAEQRDLPSSNQWQSDGTDTEVGLDFSWSIDDTSTLNVAVNPDFSQVESDEEQFSVNNQFSLFFDENRPFFLEGADYFNTQLTIFYSRNIADPDFGTKYTSKDDNSSFALLVARDQETRIIVPGSQRSDIVDLGQESDVASLRYAHNVSENSVVGVSLTHRTADDYASTLLSVDGNHQLTDTDVFRYQLIHSDTENPLQISNPTGLPDPVRPDKEQGSAYRLNYSHNDRDWSYFVSHNHFDEGFRADLGFITRSGYRKSIIGGGRRWYGGSDDFFSRVELRGDWDVSYQYDGQKLETESEFTLSLEGSSRSEIDFHFGTRDVFFGTEWFEQDFYDLAFAYRPIGNLLVGFQSSFRDAIDFSNARAGEVDSFEVFTEWQLNQHFNLELSLEKQTFDLPQAEFFSAAIANASLLYQFDEKSFLRFLLRYSDRDFNNDPLISPGISNFSDKKIGRQLLYAYKFNAKSIFYLGYSDRVIEDDQITSLTQDQRNIFAKFSYVFQH